MWLPRIAGDHGQTLSFFQLPLYPHHYSSASLSLSRELVEVEDFFKDELSDLDSEEETQEEPEPLG